MLSLATMKAHKESLADFIRRIRAEKNLSLSDVVTRSGNLISNGYISQIENHYVKSVTASKLKALAKGLGISYEEISAIAGGQALKASGLENANLRAFLEDVEKLSAANKGFFMQAVILLHKEVRFKLEEQETQGTKTNADFNLTHFAADVQQSYPKLKIKHLLAIINNDVGKFPKYLSSEDINTIQRLYKEKLEPPQEHCLQKGA